jgi:hypothetical protein
MNNDVAYNHETVHLDGQTFSNCEFRDSRLVYAGGEPPTFVNCRFDNCDWRFEDGAANTLAHLKAMWSAGAKSVVQAMIKEITGASR